MYTVKTKHNHLTKTKEVWVELEGEVAARCYFNDSQTDTNVTIYFDNGDEQEFSWTPFSVIHNFELDFLQFVISRIEEYENSVHASN